MSKHTQGPWVKCDRGDYGDFGGNSVVILGDNSCVRVAVVHHNGSDQCEANANLFFAAPDMLAALRKIREISECPNPSDVELEIIEICDVVAHKAEGGHISRLPGRERAITILETGK